MGKEALEKVNSDLISYLIPYLKEKGINDACYYEPVNDTYWSNNHKYKIAFCNLEPYYVNDKDKLTGINLLTSTILYDSWFFTPTTGNTIFLNYVIQKYLTGSQNASGNILRTIRNQMRTEDSKQEYKKWYIELCESFNQSLYFNFRYSFSSTVTQSSGYIYGCYKNDFYRNHYRKYVNAAEIDILIVSGKVGADLIRIIYPEIQDKFQFKGAPVMFDGTLFVSVPHFSRISYAAMADCINKIANTMKK